LRFPAPLVEGTLLRRYKRFLADVELASGGTVTAACPNTGSMLGCCEPGSRVWLSENDSPTRKYRHTWELVEAGPAGGEVMVGINTGLPNRLVAEAIGAGVIGELAGYGTIRREVPFGEERSRIDLYQGDMAGDFQFALVPVEIGNLHAAEIQRETFARQ